MNEFDSVDPQWAWAPCEAGGEAAWNPAAAAHLYRRAGFGADMATISEAAAATPADVVDELLERNAEPTEFRSTADTLAKTVLGSGNPQRLSAAWVYRLIRTPTPLLENLTLFWHGHFATSAEKVANAGMMWDQNRLLREHALGDFGELTQAIAKDPAMLIYLDSAVNRKAHPNENFARELMELFCLGEGNYSETDVLELARCFTGWEIKNDAFRKNRYRHDDGTKRLFGKRGRFDGEAGVRLVLQQPSMEMFLARKWFRYFIADEPAPSEALLRPVAEAFRRHELRVTPVIRLILRSNLFFSAHSVGRKIKSPVTLIVGMLRGLRATTNTQLVARGLREIGQGLFYPPSVEGWAGGRSWINSSTFLGRANLIGAILDNEATSFDGRSLSEYLKSFDVATIDGAIDHFETCFLPTPLSGAAREVLRRAYRDRISAGRERGLRSLLHAFMTLPECQLG